MMFLRLLLDLTGLDGQRNPDIRNILQVDSILEDIKLYRKNSLDHLKWRDKPPTEVVFPVPTYGTTGYGKN
jgi:hypothetical protein